MNEEIKIIIKAVTDSAKKGVNEVRKELEGLSKSGKGASSSLGASMKAIGKSAAVAVAGIAAVTGALVVLGKSTMEYRQEQAKLIAGFEAAGSSAQQASETYNQLFRFLGKSDVAVEAANHLAKITTSQKDLAEWTKIAQGVYATFGDSLPIEGLTESANETLRVGKVTGNLADALNWAGVSEDEFNAKLAATNSYSEREALLRSTLNGLYSDAANIYERNNAALLAYNESQARLDSSMARAGAAVQPLMTALNNLGSAFFNALTPALNAVIPIISSFVNWIAKGIEAVLSFFSALTGKSSSIKAISQVGAAAGGAAKSLGGAANGAGNLGKSLGGAGGGAKDLADNMEDAKEKTKKAAEEAKRSTQGFDELNILSSEKSSAADAAAKAAKKASGSGGSGGSGGGGGGSGSPGYASPGGGASDSSFSTEISETGGLAEGLTDRLKGVFSDLKDMYAPSIAAWSEALNTVKESWNKAKPDFINGAENIKQAFETLGSYLWNDFVPTVVNSFSTNLAPVLGDLAGFSLEEAGKAFSWFGEAANTATNDLIVPSLESIKTVATDIFDVLGTTWEEKGGGFLTEASTAFENIRTTIDNFYNTTFKPIFDTVKSTFDDVWKNGLKPMYEKYVEAFLDIGTNLLKLYNEFISPVVNWIINNIFPIIVEVIENVIKSVGKVLTAITTIIGGIIQVIQGIVQFITGVFTGDWDLAWEGIKTIFKGFWEAIKGIVDLILGVFKGVITFLKDIFVAAWRATWETIKGIWSVVVAFFQGIWDGICKVFEKVKEWFSEKFKAAWEAIKEAWSTVKTWFQDIWNGICQVFEKVKEWFKGKFEDAWNAITTAWSNVKTWFSGRWNDITGVFSGVGTWFKDKFDDAWTKIKNVFSNWGSFFSGLWDTIKSTFSSLGTSISSAIGGAVKSGLNGVISMIENTINSAIGLINGAINLINKLPGVSVGKVGRLSLPRLAKGGIVDTATIAMIGERGKEAVVPLENNTEWMDKLADKLSERNSAPSKIVLTLDGRELGWASINSINGITKQTGNLQLQLA